MALNNLGLGFVFTARDLASAQMARLERRFTSLDERVTGGTARMSSAFRQLGLGLAVFTAGTAVVAGGLALANAAGRFEQGLAAVGAVTRATTAQLHMLRQAAIQAGIETQFSPDEAVAGLQSLATAGQTAEQATRTLVPVLDLAAGSLGQLGVAQAAEAVVGTLNAYGFAADQAASVTDRLLRITQLTNFQARDFEAGLAKAAAAGSVFGQELDDVLITMGLLRNRNIDASSASTAFRESVRRVGAESRAQQAILGAGVQIFDAQTGRMRSIVDIMGDFASATRGMTEEERNRRVATAFGARGLLAFNAILNASFTTMRDGREVTLQGAEAIEALRRQMADAGGTAQDFREQLLDTFAGQKTLLQGTLQTFAVVLGEPFAAVFKPIVAAVVDALNFVLRAFQAIPAPIKTAFAGFTLAAGALLALVGGVIAAKASLALLVIGFKVLGITIGGLAAVLLPAILVVGALGAAVAGFAAAFHHNLGGIGDVVRQGLGQLQLFFAGLTQLFEQGGFSGAVREELGRAENQGLKRFLIAAWQVAFRILQIWEGFQAGFTSTLQELRPVFADLAGAMGVLQQEVIGLYGTLTGGAAALPSAEFRTFGQALGAILATGIAGLARLWAISVRVSGGIIAGFRGVLGVAQPVFRALGDSLERLGSAWRLLSSTTRQGTEAVDASTSSWRLLGMFLGQVFGGAITVSVLALTGLIDLLTTAIAVVGLVRLAFITAGDWIDATAARIVSWFSQTLPDTVRGALGTIAGFLQTLGRLLRQIPGVLLPGGLGTLLRQPLSLDGRPEGAPTAVDRTRSTAARAEAASSAMPALADTSARTSPFAHLEATLRSLVGEGARDRGQSPVHVAVQVDGETIARATHQAERDSASRAFAPVPVY